MQPRLVIVGGGRMGSALARGLLGSGWRADDLVICEAVAARREQLRAELPGVSVGEDVPAASGAVVAVKPGDGEAACRAVARSGTGRVLSIMAGVTLARLESWLGPSVAVLRAMPNTPATVGVGVSGVAAGSGAGAPDLTWGTEILGAVGRVVSLPEPALDAVTGLSGSGPAYVFLVAEALIAGGVAAGLAPEVSRTLAVETLAGASRLLALSGQTPETLRAQVTSPGGTTEAGLAVLEERAVRAAFADAVVAATERSRQLGR